MTDKQYQIILALYNELHTEFQNLSEPIQALFFARLYGK
jgi:hypothetical protein